MDTNKYKVMPATNGQCEKQAQTGTDVDAPKPFSQDRKNYSELLTYHFDSHIGKKKTQIVGLLSSLLMFVIIYGLIYYGVNKNVI